MELYHFHLIKTLWANFKLLPFRQAIFCPFVIYNKTQVKLSRSSMKLNVPPRFGLIKWGFQNDWQTSKYQPSLLMMVNGKLIINGSSIIAPGVTVRIHEGCLSLGEHSFIGGGCKVLSNNNIAIGSNCILAFNCVVCDTDFHYMEHDGKIKNSCGNIILGDNCWIGNYTTIMRGAILPSHTTVGSKSYVNKDFSATEPGSILIGTPARIIKSGYKRVPSQREGFLRQYFKTTSAAYYQESKVPN